MRLASLALLLALAVPEGPDLERVRTLEEQGNQWFDRAGNTDLSTQDRNVARKTAYPLLKEAATILESWCEAHPDDLDRFEDRLIGINRNLYWIRKESPIGLLDEFTRKPGGAAPPPSPSPSPTPDPGPMPSPAPPPIAPPPPDPFRDAEAYDKSHPFDEAGSLDRWLEFLSAAPDRSSDSYRRALERVSLLSDGLKAYYRKIRNEDPDALDPEKDAGRAAEVAGRAAEGLNAADPATRRAAAAELANLGWSPAGLSLYQALRREKDTGVRADLLLALVRLGGRRACENLARFAKEKDPDLASGSVRSLAAIAKKDAVQARYASRALGEFPAEAKVPAAGMEAIQELRGLGKAGLPGLLRAADTKSADLEAAVLAALGDAGDPAGAPTLCDRLEEAKAPAPRLEAAREAIRKIGKPAIPALIDALKKGKTRRHAATLLYEISEGQTFGEDPKAWAEWWRNRK